ncbi:MAG: class I SAM-dependent methyltransferase [Caldilineaceae bacterium]|nr:class I SAM-dependent methyltransferase [Caldilineaceae bacterium]MBP8106873.1 class I SAM-dependent methyltransferase [Caldilineaceae bacterium]MBP8122437.1 class I SAM-dependent methyltransferase [Caldilineaceae bacterium]MBP9072241.1 class I SAM-dependent methyltransferase [Caldilineaceae bacterium]
MTNQPHDPIIDPVSPVNLDGLDDAFLRYIGVESETQRYIQEPYLAQFEACRRVVDLGCGDGDFVALLIDHDHEALGVDGDSRAAQRVRERGLPVAESNVFPWLAAEVEAVEGGDRPAWDGIFCAHLVEHLPYERVLELCHQAARILRPGGVIVLATPNVAAIHAHLDGYYKHFGHVTFYHPDLLSFFLAHCGFEITQAGANERVPSTLFFPVIRELNEHQVELGRLENVCAELLPKHSDLAGFSTESHERFTRVYDDFTRLHEEIGAVHGAVGRLLSGLVEPEIDASGQANEALRQIHRQVGLLAEVEAAAKAAGQGDDAFGRRFQQLGQVHATLGLQHRILTPGSFLGRVRQRLARLIFGDSLAVIDTLAAQGQNLTDAVAEINARLAEVNAGYTQSLGFVQELANITAHVNVRSALNRSLVRESMGQVHALAEALAQLNGQMAEMAELWQRTQSDLDQVDDLAARYGTVARDLGRVGRRAEESVRLLIGQIDAPFEAFVIARKLASEAA